MRASALFRAVCGLAILLASAALALNLTVRTQRGQESEVFNTGYFEANGEKLALLVPYGWQARAGEKAGTLSLVARSGESPITVEFSSHDAQPLLASADALRQAVTPFWPDARVVDEFPMPTGHGMGRGVDLTFSLQGFPLRARAVVVPLRQGYAGFHISYAAEKQENFLPAFNSVVSSFRAGSADGPGNFITVSEVSPEQENARPKSVLGQEAAQVVAVLHTEAPPPLPPPPPPKPIFAGYENFVRFGVLGVLLAVLIGYTVARDREMAEVRALCGGYLSDGTEVANFQMPEWFAVQSAPQVPVPAPEWIKDDDSTAAPAPVVTPVQKFLEEAPALLNNVRDVLRELGRAGSDTEFHALLKKLTPTFTVIKERTNFWEMRPVWQLSSAIELLAQRVAEKPKDATPSTLRTITAATDLLQALCAPDVRPNLIIDPPLRVLAVDDDPLCVRAVVFALQKAGLASETAANGVQAVALAEAKPFDVIFMDIQMPEMDGLAACKKIRATKANAETPVVFVTIQSDFHTRAQTTLTGGTDLMAKPFLVFELTVKALMASMRKRLQTQQSANQPALLVADAPAPAAIRAAISSSLSLLRPVTTTTTAVVAPVKPVEKPAAPEPKQPFAERCGTLLLGLQSAFDEAALFATQGEAKEPLGVFYVQVHAFTAEAQKAGFELAALLGTNLERLAKKLYEKPQQANPSTLHTVASALQLLREVCRPELEKKSADASRVRMLVVDDEPLARRAITSGLQLVFDKPDSAQDGSEALALAREHAYDVIFTDVRMPEMDGFALCAAVRETEKNRTTPVIFVTALGDDESREQAQKSGGTDFIAKPCLPAEITLKALTYLIRKRLDLPAPVEMAPAHATA